jgi:hypothetical protein
MRLQEAIIYLFESRRWILRNIGEKLLNGTCCSGNP